MVNNDFKLNFYFEMYKDTPIIKRQWFRYSFYKKHGRFCCMNELMFMIEEYQREKYGTLLEHIIEYAPSKYKKGRR